MNINISILKRICFGFISVVVLTFFLFGATNSVSALTTTRYVAPSGVDVGNCSSSVTPCLTVQYAVNKSASGDSILVAQGTYIYSAGLDPCSFLLTRAVVCFTDKSLTILGGYSTANWSTANPSVNLTVIDGGNTYRGVAVVGYLTTTTNIDMEGFTIQNGRAQGPLYSGVSGGRGGGMWVVTAATTLKDMVFKNNRAIGDNTAGVGGSADGSGLTIDSSPAGKSSLLQRVTFDGNQSLGGVGSNRGGVAFGALFVVGSTATIDSATFTNNLAHAGNSTGNGTSGGLNADALGGAIALEQSSVALNQIVATNNQAIGGNAATNAGGAFGGAIYSENGSSFVMTDSHISSNTAQAGNALTGGFGAGGGMLVYNTPATIDRVKLVANSAIGGSTTGGGSAGAGGGGGLYLWRSNLAINPNSSVANTIITDNYVTIGSGTVPGGGGGGIQAQGVTATISHSTIARNRLGLALISGQGLLVLAAPGVSSSTVNLNYSIIADHTVGGSGAAAVLVQSGNTINFNRGLFAGNTLDKNILSGGTQTGQATMLSASSAGFISPGSPNYDYHLRPDSAARDQAIGSTTAIDLDAQSRPYNSVSDFGAYEYWPVTISRSVLRGDSTLQLNWTLGGGTFTGSVSKYEIVVTCVLGANSPIQGSCGAPINVGTVTTFSLTGLSNFKPYTIVINAYDASLVLIAASTPITATPTNTLANGSDTTGVFRPSNGLLYLKHANTTGFADIGINYGTGGDYPVVGDWDGNGTATIGIYRNGSFYLRNSNTLGFADLVFAFGTPGDQPIAGDWDGDGIDTIGIFRTSTGQFLLRNSNTSGAADMSFYLGNVGDVGIAGDWNGDGLDTTGVFRPSNGVIFMKNTNATGFADIAINYGLGGDQPVVGDWDNDGIDTIGVYRSAQFYLRNSNTLGFADMVFALGNPGDMPIVGNWDGSIP